MVFLAPMVCGLAVVVLSFMYGGGGCWDVAIFKASALWADAFSKSICPYVCALLRYRLTVFLPPLPEVGC